MAGERRSAAGEGGATGGEMGERALTALRPLLLTFLTRDLCRSLRAKLGLEENVQHDEDVRDDRAAAMFLDAVHHSHKHPVLLQALSEEGFEEFEALFEGSDQRFRAKECYDALLNALRGELTADVTVQKLHQYLGECRGRDENVISLEGHVAGLEGKPRYDVLSAVVAHLAASCDVKSWVPALLAALCGVEEDSLVASMDAEIERESVQPPQPPLSGAQGGGGDSHQGAAPEDPEEPVEGEEEGFDVVDGMVDMEEEGEEMDVDLDQLQRDMDLQDEGGRGHEGEALRLREYQNELAERALHGDNVIICAPTGSGKTPLACFLIQRHLQRVPAAGDRKVALLARTTALVSQHFREVRGWLPQLQDRVCMVTGESGYSTKLHLLAKHRDILVMTPRILINHVKEKKLSLGRFSLLVLDECHHIRNDSVYGELADLLLMALRPAQEQGSLLPQIVGLTASIGVGSATVKQEAETSILEVMARINVPSIATVQHNVQELRQYVSDPEKERVTLHPHVMDASRKDVEGVMENLEGKLAAVYREHRLQVEELEKLIQRTGVERSSLAYLQWAGELRRQARLAEIKFPQYALAVRSLYVIADHLTVYNSALSIHFALTNREVVKCLQDNITQLRDAQEKRTPLEEELFTMLHELRDRLQKHQEAPGYENPNLRLLADKVREVFGGGDARVILFVHSRVLCEGLTHWFNASSGIPNLRAKAITGIGQRGSSPGMTQAQQDKVVQEFDKGEVNLLVATAVGEEGLNIPDCNCSILFNHVGNEISAVQMRGRTRKAGGKTVLVAEEKILTRDRINQEKEALMMAAVAAIQRMRHEDLQARMAQIQQTRLQELKEELAAEQQQEAARRAEDFRLVCKCCRRLGASSRDLRVLKKTHLVVVRPGFLKEVDLKALRKKITFDQLTKSQHMRCLTCDMKWGCVMQEKKVQFPVLKLNEFTLEHSNGKCDEFSNFKEVPYVIREVTHEDRLAMLHHAP